jgi:hypothetical protein
MTTTTLAIRVDGLGRGQLAKLRAQAKQLGLTAEGYAKRLIEEGIRLQHRAGTKSLDEVWAPVQAEFRESGMTERELDDLVDRARGPRRIRRRTGKKR